jgi:hypothetical protein
MKPFVLDPPVCDITYECVSVSSNNTSVKCNDTGIVNFNPISGNFIFTTFDKETYSPGVYNFTLRGKAGTSFPVQHDVIITITLSDPCPTVKPLVIN